MADFRMPSLGADMKAGILVAWRVKAGDRVRQGDIIAEVETDKGLFEVEVFEDGVVEELLAVPGKAKIAVGTLLATIGTGKAVAAEAGAEKPKEVKEPKEPPRAKASPAARKLAEELGVDLLTVAGSGPHGVISREDVERAAKATETEAVQKETPAAGKPADGYSEGMRRAIARAMSRANSEIPHYYLQTDIDMSRALKWLEQENRQRSINERLLPAVLLLKAVAKGLEKVPELNGYWKEDCLQVEEPVHIGFAIALRGGGLITPALHDANKKSPDELMAALGDLIGRTRAGRLRGSEMTDATITVTSLGDLGVETVYGVIYPPQVALVGFGRIAERPWAEGGLLGVRPVLTATLAADHRATDGHQGAQFLEAVDRALQQPETL